MPSAAEIISTPGGIGWQAINAAGFNFQAQGKIGAAAAAQVAGYSWANLLGSSRPDAATLLAMEAAGQAGQQAVASIQAAYNYPSAPAQSAAIADSYTWLDAMQAAQPPATAWALTAPHDPTAGSYSTDAEITAYSIDQAVAVLKGWCNNVANAVSGNASAAQAAEIDTQQTPAPTNSAVAIPVRSIGEAMGATPQPDTTVLAIIPANAGVVAGGSPVNATAGGATGPGPGGGIVAAGVSNPAPGAATVLAPATGDTKTSGLLIVAVIAVIAYFIWKG